MFCELSLYANINCLNLIFSNKNFGAFHFWRIFVIRLKSSTFQCSKITGYTLLTTIASLEILASTASSTAPQSYKSLPANEDLPESTGPTIARFRNGVLLSNLFVNEGGNLGDISVEVEGGLEGKILLSVRTDGDRDRLLEQASNCISWKASVDLCFRLTLPSNLLTLPGSLVSLLFLLLAMTAEDPDFIILSTVSPEI